MLHFFRENAKGWLGYIIVAGIIMVFIPWGISSYTQDANEAAVAIVNGNDITLQQYQRTYQQQRSRIQSMLGENASPEMVESILQPQNILDGLVERELILNAADESGFRIGDKQLVAQIQLMDAFQQDGRFSKPTYERILRNSGFSSTGFESSMLSDALISQVNLGMRSTALVTNSDVDRYIRIKNQEREVATLIVPAAKFEKDITVEDEKIEQYYKENLQQFVTPEKVSVSYVELKISDIQATIKYTEDELKKVYESQKSSFGVGEERKASHILLEITNPDDEKEVNSILEKANKLKERIEGGESFAEIAKKESDDPGSSVQGGDLGYFGKNIMDPAFESTAFAMKEGDVSDPVKTSFGYHIIKLEKIRPGSHKPFEQVRDELIEIFTKQKAEDQFFDQSETLANLAYEQPDSLDTVSELMKLEIKNTALFDDSGNTVSSKLAGLDGRPGEKDITSNKKLVQIAFSNEVLKKNYNSEPIEVSTNHLVVIHLKEHQKQKQKELAVVKDDIKFVLKKDIASDLAVASGEKIVKLLKDGGDIATEIKTLGIAWQEKKFIKRQEGNMDRLVVETIFKLNKPKDNAVVTDGLKVRNGDYVIYQFFATKTPDASKVEKAERDRLSKELTTVYSNKEFDNFLASLKQNASVQIFAENIEQ